MSFSKDEAKAFLWKYLSDADTYALFVFEPTAGEYDRFITYGVEADTHMDELLEIANIRKSERPYQNNWIYCMEYDVRFLPDEEFTWRKQMALVFANGELCIMTVILDMTHIKIILTLTYFAQRNGNQIDI